jgi:hypothetical protein
MSSNAGSRKHRWGTRNHNQFGIFRLSFFNFENPTGKTTGRLQTEIGGGIDWIAGTGAEARAG